MDPTVVYGDDSTSDYASAVLADSPLAYWRFEETSGATALDSAGSGYDGTVVGATTLGGPGALVAESADRALGFDGLGSHVALPAWSPDLSDGLTIEAWIYPTARNTYARVIDFGNGVNSDNIILARNGTSDDLYVHVFRGGTDGGRVTAPGVLRLNAWQHVAATVDAAGNAVVYVNGVPVASGRTAAPRSVLRTQNYVGRSNYSWDVSFKGSMDEVALYPSVLAAATIQARYRTGAAVTPPAPPSSGYGALVLGDGPVGYWRLGEAGGSVAYDVSGSGHDGLRQSGLALTMPGALAADLDGATQFDGSSGYITVPPGFADFSTGLTVEAWIYPTVRSSSARIVDFGTGGPGDNIIFTRRGTSDDLVLHVFNGSSPGGEIIAAGVLQLGTWQHVAATVDAAGNGVIYVNGAPVASGRTAAPRTVTRTRNYLGHSNWSQWDANFNGVLDEVAIYPTSLSAEQIRRHYLLGQGDPAPVVQMVALPSSSTTNPLTISWAPTTDPSAIQSYTVTYQIDEAPAATLGTVPGSTTSLDIYVGDATAYRFAVTATSYTGKRGPQSDWASTFASLPAVVDEGPDDDPDLFDPAGGPIACIPSSDVRQLLVDLLLASELCSAEQVQVTWQQSPPPLVGYVCPGTQLPLVAAIPGYALLGVGHPSCVALGGSGVVTATKGGANDIHAQYRAARDRITSTLTSKGYSPAVVAAVTEGVKKVVDRIETLLANGKYSQAWAYVRQLQRTAVYVDELPADRVLNVELQVSTGRVPDVVIRIVDQAGTVRTYLLEIKTWPSKLLANPGAQSKLVEQLRDMTRATEYDGVLVEFVQHSTSPITQRQQVLDVLAGSGLNGNRLAVEVVRLMGPAQQLFTPVGGSL